MGHTTLWLGTDLGELSSCLMVKGTMVVDKMFLVCHMVFLILRDQRVMWLYGWEPLIVSHHCAKFIGHRRCGSGDIKFLVVEEEDSRRSCCLSLKDIAWKHMAYHINYSDPGLTHLKQQFEKNMKLTFVSLSKTLTRRRRRRNGKTIAMCFALHVKAKKQNKKWVPT